MGWYVYIQCPHCENSHYEDNYTSNINGMMADAGAEMKDFDGLTVVEALPKLRGVIANLKANRAKYEAMNPSNGWGSYKGILGLLERLEEEMRNSMNGDKIAVSW